MKSHTRGILAMVLLWSLFSGARLVALILSVIWVGTELFLYSRRFGRKGLIAFAAIAAIFVAVVGYAVVQTRANMQLVAEIEARGASKAILGPPASYGSISHISLGPEIGDEQLAHILDTEGLKELDSISFDQSTVTDTGLFTLKRFPELTFIHIEGTPITEEGVAQLEQQLPDCRILYEPED